MLSERREKIYKNIYKNEGNTEKENNGYVVFNWNIHKTVMEKRADRLKDDWLTPRRQKPVFDKRAFGQTNEQQRHFNE